MNTVALTLAGPASPLPTAPQPTPLQIVHTALQSGNVEMYREAIALMKEMDGYAARKEFDAAIAAAKSEIPPIQRNATGHNDKRYADFAAIARVVDPILGKHGLSYRFRTTQNERISVTCVLSHKAGHFEETTLTGPADTSGNKNAIQAIGSTLTYLQRYSLVQMLGLAAANDDDGNSAGGFISPDQLEQLVALADEVEADKEAFSKYFRIDGMAQLPAKDFDRAISALNKKRRVAQ